MKLNIDLAKTLKAGDYIEYIYPSTDVNPNEVVHKCIFIEFTEIDENDFDRMNNKVKNIPSIKVRNMNNGDSFGMIEHSGLTIPSSFNDGDFRVYRNGFKLVDVIRINEVKYDRITS